LFWNALIKIEKIGRGKIIQYVVIKIKTSHLRFYDSGKDFLLMLNRVNYLDNKMDSNHTQKMVSMNSRRSGLHISWGTIT